MTLVEVVAGIAMLSTLLVSILVAFRSHTAQVRTAQDRLAAIEIADGLLTEWTADDEFPAVGEHGSLPQSDGLSWRLVQGDASTINRLGLQIVRLEIFRDEVREQSLTSVELLVQGTAVAVVTQ